MCEATPNYLFDPRVPLRMWETIPEGKLVVVLRNPVDRAYSHYWQKRSYGTEPLSFEEALAAEPQRISRDDRARRLYSYVARGRYLEQLERFAAYFPRDSIGVFLFEELHQQPLEIFGQVCRFVGVSDRVKLDVVGRELNSYQQYRLSGLRSLSRRLKGPIGKLIGKVNAKEASYPPMARTVRERLVELYREDYEALAKWTGLDLSSWEH
jgi:hypothetical protein